MDIGGKKESFSIKNIQKRKITEKPIKRQQHDITKKLEVKIKTLKLNAKSAKLPRKGFIPSALSTRPALKPKQTNNNTEREFLDVTKGDKGKKESIVLRPSRSQTNSLKQTIKLTTPQKLPKPSPRREVISRSRESTASLQQHYILKDTPSKILTHQTTVKRQVDKKNKLTKILNTKSPLRSTPKVKASPVPLINTSKLNDVINEFRKEHKGSLVRANFAYKIDSPDHFFILAYLNYPVKSKEWKMFKNFKVLFMDYLYVDSEAIRVAVDERTLKIKLPESTETELRKTITKHADRLMSEHSNLEILSGSAVRSKQKGQVIEKENCIVLFCRNKGYIPICEKPYPKEIDGFSVDVREGFFQWSPTSENQSAKEYQTYLRMGCSIGAKQNFVKGSLGGFVDIEENGLGFITCAHVVHTIHELQNPSTIQANGTIVNQPAVGELPPNDTRRKACGTVLRHAFDTNSDIGVDCAVVAITERKPTIAEFCNINEESLRKAGFEPSEALRYTNGKIIENPNQENYKDRRLIKCGRSTGLRRGTFEFNGAAVRVEEVHLGLDRMALPLICLKGQYLVNSIGFYPFVEEGDSGAFVFVVEDDNSLSCVGMVEGLTTQFFSVITPIKEILKKLNLDQTTLHVFPEDLMETD